MLWAFLMSEVPLYKHVDFEAGKGLVVRAD